MSTSYSPTGPLPIAQVSDSRLSTPSKPKHHAHSAFGLVSIHGFVLSSSFLALSLGLVAIRSGLAKSFKYHWMIQLVASAFILLGCGMGIILTFKHGGRFHTTHQWLGLLLGLGVEDCRFELPCLGWEDSCSDRECQCCVVSFYLRSGCFFDRWLTLAVV